MNRKKKPERKTNPLPKNSPNLIGRCERFIGIIRWECLDRFIIFGKRILDYVKCEVVAYDNTRLSHMKHVYLPPIREVSEELVSLTLDQIEVKSYCGWLVKSSERTAA